MCTHKHFRPAHASGDLKIGGAAYSDFDFRPHLGVEGEFNFVRDPADLYEKTYAVGGRYFRPYKRWVPYAKVMYERGVFNFPPLSDGFRANLAYNLIAPVWASTTKRSPGSTSAPTGSTRNGFDFQNSSLSPSILTLEAAYRFR